MAPSSFWGTSWLGKPTPPHKSESISHVFPDPKTERTISFPIRSAESISKYIFFRSTPQIFLLHAWDISRFDVVPRMVQHVIPNQAIHTAFRYFTSNCAVNEAFIGTRVANFSLHYVICSLSALFVPCVFHDVVPHCSTGNKPRVKR